MNNHLQHFKIDLKSLIIGCFFGLVGFTFFAAQNSHSVEHELAYKYTAHSNDSGEWLILNTETGDFIFEENAIGVGNRERNWTKGDFQRGTVRKEKN
jgi:hypothetical protein